MKRVSSLLAQGSDRLVMLVYFFIKFSLKMSEKWVLEKYLCYWKPEIFDKNRIQKICIKNIKLFSICQQFIGINARNVLELTYFAYLYIIG